MIRWRSLCCYFHPWLAKIWSSFIFCIIWRNESLIMHLVPIVTFEVHTTKRHSLVNCQISLCRLIQWNMHRIAFITEKCWFIDSEVDSRRHRSKISKSYLECFKWCSWFTVFTIIKPSQWWLYAYNRLCLGFQPFGVVYMSIIKVAAILEAIKPNVLRMRGKIPTLYKTRAWGTETVTYL